MKPKECDEKGSMNNGHPDRYSRFSWAFQLPSFNTRKFNSELALAKTFAVPQAVGCQKYHRYNGIVEELRLGARRWIPQTER